MPSSGSKKNKDLHTVIAKQVERAGHTGESWSYILKIEPMTFSDGLKMWCEKKEESRVTLIIFQNKKKLEMIKTEMGKTVGGINF